MPMRRSRRWSRWPEPRWPPTGSIEGVVEPDRSAVEQELGHVGAPVEHVAEDFLPEIDPCEGDFDARRNRNGPVGSVGHGSEAVDSAHVQREDRPADASEIGGENQQVGAGGERRQGEREGSGKGDRAVGFARFAFASDLVLEGDQRSRVDFDGDVEVERTIARPIGVQVDFPRLAVRVGLDEVAFVVNMEPVLGDVVLEIGDEPVEIDNGHGFSLP